MITEEMMRKYPAIREYVIRDIREQCRSITELEKYSSVKDEIKNFFDETVDPHEGLILIEIATDILNKIKEKKLIEVAIDVLNEPDKPSEIEENIPDIVADASDILERLGRDDEEDEEDI